MEGQGECFVSGGMAAFLRMAKLAGLAPLRFLKNGDGWRVRTSPAWTLYGYFMIALINSTTIISLIVELQLSQEATVRMRSNMQRAVWTVQACFMVLASSTAVCTAPRQMHAMTACFNQMQKINVELNINHWPTSLGRKMVCIIFMQAVVCITISMMNYGQTVIAGTQINEELWINVVYLCYFFAYWILQLRNLQFILIVLHVKYSFKVVNEQLLNILKDLETAKMPFSKSMVNVIKKLEPEKTYVNNMSNMANIDSDVITSKLPSSSGSVRRLALVFAALSDVVRDVDRSQGLMVLLMLTNFLLHLVCSPFFFITYLLDNESAHHSRLALLRFNVSNLRVAIQLLWCCYHTFNLVMIIEPCHLTHMEMRRTRELVGHLMRCPRSIYDPLAMELEQFFRYLALNDVAYEPLKLTKMTRTLIFTLLGSITTYTVVILRL